MQSMNPNSNSNLLIGGLVRLHEMALRGADMTPEVIATEIKATLESISPPCDFYKWNNDYDDTKGETKP